MAIWVIAAIVRLRECSAAHAKSAAAPATVSSEPFQTATGKPGRLELSDDLQARRPARKKWQLIHRVRWEGKK